MQTEKGLTPLDLAAEHQPGESFQALLAKLSPLPAEAWIFQAEDEWIPLYLAARNQDSTTFITLLLCLPTEELSTMLSMNSLQGLLDSTLTEQISVNDKLTLDEKETLTQGMQQLIDGTFTLEELAHWAKPVAEEGTAMMKQHLGCWYRDFCDEEGHERLAIEWFQAAEDAKAEVEISSQKSQESILIAMDDEKIFPVDSRDNDGKEKNIVFTLSSEPSSPAILQNRQTALHQMAQQEGLDDTLLQEEKQEMLVSVDEQAQQIVVLQVQLLDKAQNHPEQSERYAALQTKLTNLQQELHRLYSQRVDANTMLTTLKETVAELETRPTLELSNKEQQRLRQALQKSQYCADLQTKFALSPYAQHYYTEFASHLLASITSVRTVCGGFVAASASDSLVSSKKERVTAFISEHLDKVEHCGVPGLSLVAAVIKVVLEKVVNLSREQTIADLQDFFGSVSAECFAQGLARMLTEYRFAEFSVLGHRLSSIKTEGVKSQAKQDAKDLLQAIITRQCVVHQGDASAEDMLDACYTVITQAKWTALWIPYLAPDILAQSTPMVSASPTVAPHSVMFSAASAANPEVSTPPPTSGCCLIL